MIHSFRTGLFVAFAISIAFVGNGTRARADIVEANPDRYVLKHEATSALSPEKLWNKLVNPANWWHPDHTYSGDAANLSLDLQAGGLWREDWSGGSVFHGSVLQVKQGSMLRLDAPFGPLQDIAVKVVWTITITPEGEGSKVTFHEIASGDPKSGLDQLAPAVNFVKGEAIKRLTSQQAANQ
ncbi:MAG: SRPBCC domain-containing protein [Alphaproteobacteria bacterium]|nr:SRPBCC domain-containing protein [Alphaproteobacteria bacterium]